MSEGEGVSEGSQKAEALSGENLVQHCDVVSKLNNADSFLK